MSAKSGLGFWDVAYGNLRHRPFRTVCLVSIVALLAFVLFGGSLIADGLIKGTDSMSKRLGADIMVVPNGYEHAVEGILMRSEPSTLTLGAEWAGRISSVEGVELASPQLFVSSLSSECCDVPVQLIGYEQKTDFIVGPWLRTFLPGELGDGEIVVGNAITSKVGETVKFFERDYRVAARLDWTGMGFDASVFMNMKTARAAAEDYINLGGIFPPPGSTISAVFVHAARGYTPLDVLGNINREYSSLGGEISVIPAKRIISSVTEGLGLLLSFIVFLAVILWVLALLTLAIVFSVTINERHREFGIFRSLGATRRKLTALILFESALISVYGGVIGAFFSGLLAIPFKVYIGSVLNMPYIQPSFGKLALIFAASLLLSFSVGPLASLLPSIRAGKSNVYSVIREGEI